MRITNYKVLILGAGSGGISVAAKLNQSLDRGTIGIVDPSAYHYYQPFWTLAGAGIVPKEVTRKNQAEYIPDGVTWVKDSVQKIEPENNLVLLESGNQLKYEYLIVATGLKLDWSKIKGLEGHLGENGICSIYQYDVVDKTAQMIKDFPGGNAIFVMPPVPIKCAGAPQKIMYLAENIFRNNNVREKSKVQFATAGKAMFGIPAFSSQLEKIVKQRNIEPLFQHRLMAVDAEKKLATFSVTDLEGKTSESVLPFDLLHVVPTMSAHTFISDSPLSVKEGDLKGWLAVDKYTLQHLKYPNVFGIGDVTGIPNSKTGAAIRKQYPIVARNLLSVMKGNTPEAKYDGYSSCPLITEIGKVMLAEFGYDGKLMPTFPGNPARPKRSMWLLKRYLLPVFYWKGMLRGKM